MCLCVHNKCADEGHERCTINLHVFYSVNFRDVEKCLVQGTGIDGDFISKRML